MLDILDNIDNVVSNEDNKGSSENLLDNSSDNTDSEMNTVKPASPDEVDEADLMGFNNDDLVGDVGQDFYSIRFGNSDKEEEERSGEFEFAADLNLSTDIQDPVAIASADMLRPDRLDTVEEVSEPASDAITNDSLPHDGYRWPSQNTSITSADFMDEEFPPPSLNSTTSKEEVYSVTEIEVVNSFRRKNSDNESPMFRRKNSDNESPIKSLSYVNNPFEIFMDTSPEMSRSYTKATSRSQETASKSQNISSNISHEVTTTKTKSVTTSKVHQVTTTQTEDVFTSLLTTTVAPALSQSNVDHSSRIFVTSTPVKSTSSSSRTGVSSQHKGSDSDDKLPPVIVAEEAGHSSRVPKTAESIE